MKKTYTILVLLFAFAGTVFGQSGMLLSQYSDNKIVYNPGFAGMYDLLSISLNVHQSWIGLPGAPRVISFNGHAPFNNNRHAYGWSYQHEKWGNIRENMLYGNYAFKVHLKNGVVNLGLQAGIFHHQLDWDALEHIIDINDQSMRKGKVANMRFDANVGAFYTSSNWYAGFSTMHLNRPKNDVSNIEEEEGYSLERTQYVLMGGYNHQINTEWSLHPDVFVSYVNKEQLAINVGTHLVYRSNYGVGVNYMSEQKALSFGLKIRVSEDIRVGYSYDVVFGALSSSQHGSHEISINYMPHSWKRMKAYDDMCDNYQRTKINKKKGRFK